MRKSIKKAFTLVELLVVVAVIGILFVVLLSKIDFATDKAKATGVQTDFRSFQLALEAVAKEHSGFNTFGWDEGDTNADGIRNSYDEGDTHNYGVLDADETWTGRKVYTETWTGIYSLNNPKAGATDEEKISAVKALEAAVNKNLDPKLHITITPVDANSDGLFDRYDVTMARHACDPWGNEYHGQFITNASEKSTTNNSLGIEPDGQDRGAFVIYSNGPNGEHSSVEDIIGGTVVVSVLQKDKEAGSIIGTTDNNKAGQDDYAISVAYSCKGGSESIVSTATGLSLGEGSVQSVLLGGSGGAIEFEKPDVVIGVATFDFGSGPVELTWADLMLKSNGDKYGYDASLISETEIGLKAFQKCTSLKSIAVPTGVTTIHNLAFGGCSNLEKIVLPDGLTHIGNWAFDDCKAMSEIAIPDSVSSLGISVFDSCHGLTKANIPKNVTEIPTQMFYNCKSLAEVEIHEGVTSVGQYAFGFCSSLERLEIPESVTTFKPYAFFRCTSLTEINIPHGVTVLDEYTFSYCESIEEFVIPATVTSIKFSAFNSSTNVKSLRFEGTKSQWNSIQKRYRWNLNFPVTVVHCTDGDVGISPST